MNIFLRRRSARMACILMSCLLFTANAFGDLLSNTDFESAVDTTMVDVLMPPFLTSEWGVDSSSVVGPENGIVPNMGASMLRMVDDGLAFTQAVQRVDVSAFAALIDGNDACVDFLATFNAPDGPNSPVAGITVFFIGELNGNETSIFDAQIGSESINTQTIDSNVSTWEQVSIEGTTIPALTRSILVQISYQNDTLNGMPAYVDSAMMCITECPDDECTFDLNQALCVLDGEGQLTGDFSVSGLFTNLQLSLIHI